MSKRLNLTFTEQAYEKLANLAEKKGKTLTAVIRDAIAFEYWLLNEEENGASFFD